MAELGKLFYTLGLDTSQFESEIKKAEGLVRGLNVPNRNTKLSIDKSDIEKALQDATALKSALDKLKDVVRVTISGTDKTVNVKGTLNSGDINVVGTKQVNLSGTFVNDATLKSALEQQLRGVTIYDVKVDPTNIKNALQQQMWNIQVTSSQSSIGNIVKQIRTFLGINKITVDVNPNINQKDMKRLQKDVENALKGISVPVRFTKTDIQKQLSALGTFHIDAEVKLHTNTLQSQLNQVKGQITLNNNNIGAKGNAQTTVLGNVIQQQKKVNQHATDELGIRRAINDQMRTNTMLATIFGNTLGNVFATYQLQRFLEGIINIGGEIQKQRLSLGHIIDNAANANALFEQMKQLAVKSPFGLLDLMQNVRQLSAFGVEYNNLYDTMKRLSDMAAGLGIQFSRIALAYGETKERGFLDGKLVRQFSYMGLPVLQKVAEYYTQIDKLGNGAVVTAAKVRAMVSDKQVSFEDVDAVIQRMTEYGGQFYNMQDVMAESVSGKWKNLKDAIDIMYNDIAEGNSELLKAPAEILTKLTRNYDALLAVLGVVAVRLGGNRVVMAANNSIMARNTALLWTNKAAQQQNLIEAIKRNGLYKSLNATEKQRLATIQAMSLGEFKQLIRTQQLTKNDALRLVMMKQLSDEQIKYLVRLKLISQAEVDAAMKATKLTMAWNGLKASMSSIFSSANLWTLGFMVAAEAVMYFYNKAQKAKEFAKDIQQSADDFRKATSDIQSEVANLNFDNMSVGERESEIKAMVEYIKDNAPDAGKKLNEIFKVDKDGKFVKSFRERFEILQEWIDRLEEISKLDLSASVNSMSSVFDAWSVDSAAEKFIKANSETVNMFNNTIFSKRNQADILQDVETFKRKYKAAMMDALNISTDAELKGKGLRDIQQLAVSNKSWMQSFIETFDIAGAHIAKWQKQYESSVKSMGSAAHNAFQAMKRQSAGTPIDITTDKGRDIWSRIVDVTIMAEYKDKPSEVQQMVRRFMEDPTVMAQLQVSGSSSSEFIDKLIKDPKVYKDVYLNVLPQYNGALSTDPWKDVMQGITGNLDTKGAAAGWYDDVLKDAKSGYEALQKSKKMSKLYGKVVREVAKDSEGYEQVLYKAAKGVGEADKELVDAYAGNITQAENKLLAAKKAAMKTGLDWDKIYADVVKAFNQKDNGKQNKEDALLNSLKTQFDEIKKTYNEYQKWTKAVGKNNAGAKMVKLGLIDDATAADLSKPDYYKKKIQAILDQYAEELKKTEQRKKFETSLRVEVGEIELNGVTAATERALSKAEREINEAAKRYDMYKTLVGTGVERGEAGRIAAQIQPVMTEKASFYQKELYKKAAELKLVIPVGLDLNLDDKEAQDLFSGLGENGKALLPAYKGLRDAMAEGGREAANAIIEVLNKSENFSASMNAIKAKLAETIQQINNSGASNKDELIYSARMNAQKESNTLIVNQMKKSLSLDTLFGSLNNVSMDMLKTLENHLESIVKSNNSLDPQNTKVIMDLIDKIRNAEVSKSGLFSGIQNSLNNLKNAKKALQDLKNASKEGDLAQALGAYNSWSGNIKNQSVIASKRVKVKIEGKEEVMTLTEYFERLADAESNVAKGSTLLNKNMKELSSRTSQIGRIAKNLSKMLGNSSTSNVVGTFADGAMSIADSLNRIDFSQGFFGGGLSNVLNNIEQITSIGSSINDMVDAVNASQKAAAMNYTKYIQEMNSNLISTADKLIDRITKKLATATSSTDFSQGYDELVNQYSKKITALASTLQMSLNQSMRDYGESNAIPEKAKFKTQQTGSVASYMREGEWGYKNWNNILADINQRFGTQITDLYQLMMLNSEQLAYVMTNYSDALSQNKDLNDAVQQAYDLKVELEELSKTSQFLGTSWDDFYSNFISSCQDMSKTAADLGNDIYNSINNAIIDAMVDSVFKERLQSLYNSVGALYSDADGLSQSDLGYIKGEVESITSDLVKVRGQLQSANLLYDTESASSSLGSGMQSITEEEANILAGYVASMRVDLSAQRMNFETFMNEYIGKGEDTLSNIASSQLRELMAQTGYLKIVAEKIVGCEEHINDLQEGMRRVTNNYESMSIG